MCPPAIGLNCGLNCVFLYYFCFFQWSQARSWCWFIRDIGKLHQSSGNTVLKDLVWNAKQNTAAMTTSVIITVTIKNWWSLKCIKINWWNNKLIFSICMIYVLMMNYLAWSHSMRAYQSKTVSICGTVSPFLVKAIFSCH